ncbi:WD40 repeat-like protein [Polyporus arcularius HHB13444]|uniref:WD40 repeat-like protein n=1 Tax=Polyporus arcularius HHB13444 TaxID=1314778 RepID=A0A5C3PSU3_9APHY|nr:WD40 repeat-like protein [Polyporus arcularius HHB13444]
MRTNFDCWMRFANDTLGFNVTQDDIWFISGTTKTTRWVSSVFHTDSHDHAASVDAEFANVGTLKFSIKFSKEDKVQQLSKYGPRRTGRSLFSQAVATPDASVASIPPELDLKQNQCVFIHYYKLKKRYYWRSKVMQAAAGPHELPRDRRHEGGDPQGSATGSGDEAEFDEVPPPTKPFDPVDILLDYIFENSHAEIAIGSDRDIISMFKDQGIPDDLTAGIDALKPTIDVDEEGVGTVVVGLDLPGEPQESAGVTVPEVAAPEPESEPASGGNESAFPGNPQPPPPASGSSGQQGDVEGQEGLTEEEAARRRLQKQPIIWEPAANGHTGTVTSLAVSPDSKWVASGSEDTTIILWDTEDQSVVRKWEASVETVWHLAFSPDSQRLAASGNEGRVVIWDVEQGDELGTLEGHTETVHTVVWSPDGTKLATGSDDMTVRIWDAETYQQIRSLEGHNAMVTFVMFSPDGKLLASGGADYNCRLWVVETGELKHELSGHKGMVWTAAFDPEVRRVATASDDGSVRIWSVETGEELVILHEHTGPVWVVAFTEDGKQIMSASSDSTVKICNSFSGERIMEIDGHDSMVNAAQFSPDGKYIATASSDNTVKLWNRADGTNLVTFNEHNDKVTHAVFSPDGLTLSSASDDGKIRIRLLSEFIKAEGEGDGED